MSTGSIAVPHYKVSSEEIRAYAVALAQKKRVALPEAERSVVLRLPTDSVDISDEARALQKGKLRVRLDEDGAYSKVTNEDSDPRMKQIEDNMRAAKRTLDAMKTLTEQAEDESLSDDDRYELQLQLVDLEGELEKIIFRISREMDEGAIEPTSDMAVAFVTDRATGEIFEFNRFMDAIDKRTALKKEMIERVRMRELYPEEFEQELEDYRKLYREEYIRTRDMMLENSGSTELKELEMASDPGSSLEYTSSKDIEWMEGLPYSDEPIPSENGIPIIESDVTGLILYVFPDVDWGELAMERYVEEKILELEAADYREFNDMRLSVMDPDLAEESGDYLEHLTEQLTERFEKFAATNELVDQLGDTDADEERKSGLVDLFMNAAKRFMNNTILAGIKQQTTRVEDGPYQTRRAQIEAELRKYENVNDYFEATPMLWSDALLGMRPDLYGNIKGPGGSA